MNKVKNIIISIIIIVVVVISGTLIYKKSVGKKVYKDDYSVPLVCKGTEQISNIVPINIEEFNKNIEYFLIYNNLQDGNEIEYLDYKKMNNNYIVRLMLKLKNGSNTIIYSKININDKKYYFFTDEQDINGNPRIINFSTLLKNYDGNVQYSEIKNNINILKYNIEKIYKNTCEYSDEDLKIYYSIKSEELKNMGIYSENDFYFIQNQIKKAFSNGIQEINHINIEVNNTEKDEVYYSYNIEILYNNSEAIKVKCRIPNDSNSNEKVKYMSTEI